MSTPKVLIAEDEKMLSFALQKKLQIEGIDVRVVSNGQECLDALEKEDFGVVLLDLIMPVMTGFDVLERLGHARLSELYVIVLSNLSQKGDEEKARALGAKGFMIKSNTDLTTIVETIKNIAGK